LIVSTKCTAIKIKPINNQLSLRLLKPNSTEHNNIAMVSTATHMPYLPAACNTPCSASHPNVGKNASVTLPAPPIVPYSTSTMSTDTTADTSNRSRSSRSGRWTPDEKLLFLHGLHIFGRGRWKKIRQFLPTRTLIQIKSHAQKVLKREQAGNDIFTPLRNNKSRIKELIKDKSRLFQNIAPIFPNEQPPSYDMIHAKRLSTSQPYYRQSVSPPAIAPYPFVSTDRMNSPEHLMHPPQTSLSHYHAHPRHPSPRHHSMHPHIYRHITPPPPPTPQASQNQGRFSQSHSQLQNVPASKKATSSRSTPHLQSEKPPTKTTDVLAATALCELFRGNNDDVAQ